VCSSDLKSTLAIIDIQDAKEVLMKGIVKWFNKNKGYGFILTEDNKEYFVHWKSIVTNSPRELKVLEQDEEVTFDLIETEKGIQAINIIRTHP
jgi:CspA family cold shock protein